MLFLNTLYVQCTAEGYHFAIQNEFVRMLLLSFDLKGYVSRSHVLKSGIAVKVYSLTFSGSKTAAVDKPSSFIKLCLMAIAMIYR